ncbi:hypothetical protein [Pseudonocardia sp. N23]|uniref:hypothetical protein n=1 Tax=Pseudonocardia sp. N23 TaxID=1987376 RepID=UPI0015591183|nr:hypothetical protein [Pseudonocardia sp. N23]
MRWKAGPGSENVDRTTAVDTEPWAVPLQTERRELEVLVAHEGVRQEYRLDPASVPVIV